MINLYEIHGVGRTLIKEFATFTDALVFVNTKYHITYYETDETVKDAADFLTMTGGQYAIQPAIMEVP